jgi:hypothetical protein
MAAPQPPSKEVRSWRLPWNELVDGRLRRFKRGVHYSGMAEALEQEARNAANELGKTAITFRDNMQVLDYMWVQFVDGRLEEGKPCPKCSNTSFEKLQEYFLRCTRCRSFFAITEPKPVIPAPEKPLIAKFGAFKLLSANGDEIDQVHVHDELLLELTCYFHRPISAVHVAFNFFSGTKKMLYVGSDQITRVPEPETVKFTLWVSPNVLPAGDYVVSPGVEAILEKGNDPTRLMKAEQPMKELRVSDDQPIVSNNLAAERRRFQWGAPSATSGKLMPVTHEWRDRDAEA